MNNPINRTTIQTASNKYKIYGKGAPCNYKKSDGTYEPIDLTFNDATSTIGDISLLEKNVVSVGIRKDNNPHKYVGIRPDNNQADGTQQLEFSLIGVELDGENQLFSCEDDYEVKVEASSVKQLVKINKDFKDFKVEFDIHAKNLPIVNEKYTEETVVRDYGFNIKNLGEIEAGNTEHTLNNIFTESKDIPYIDCCISKVTNDYITLGEYSIEEEFGDSDLSSYVLDSNAYPNGGAAYLKDCIMLIAKSHNIESSIEDIFVNQICDEYGLETIWEDNKNGQYFTKDGKKVASYYSYDNQFYMFINTKAISDEIKTLFKRKTFNDTSYLDITLDSFKSSIESKLDLTLQLKVDSNYYQPIQDIFKFKISDEYFYIYQPLFFDESYNLLELKGTHTLKDNGDGSYRYTKYFGVAGRFLNEGNIKYIDTNLGISEVQSGMLELFSAVTQAQLDSSRNASTATSLLTINVANIIITAGQSRSTLVLNGSSTTTGNFYQTHCTFDSSGITDEATDLKYVHYSSFIMSDTGTDTYDDVSIIFLKSNTEGGNITSNWNDFVGFTSGWDGGDVTEYTGEVLIDSPESSVFFPTASTGNTDKYETEFNATAKTDVENDDEFKFAIIEYDEFYGGTIDSSWGPTSGANELTFRHFMSTTEAITNASLRPYLEVTTGEAEAVTYNANFFGANF